MESMIKKAGSWLFLIGICIALLVGLIFGVVEATQTTLSTQVYDASGIIIAVLGFIVGVLSFFALGAITHERIPTFLIASIILIGLGIAVNSASSWIFGDIQWYTPIFANITQYLAIFVAPAAIILVVRSLWDAGSKETTQKTK
jgi:drug/metabolite transporter (DMT)-like permease